MKSICLYCIILLLLYGLFFTKEEAVEGGLGRKYIKINKFK